MSAPATEPPVPTPYVTKDDWHEFKGDIRREIILWVGVSAGLSNVIAAAVAWAKFSVTPPEAAAAVWTFLGSLV